MSNTEKISAYLDNEMSAEEKLQFEKALANDSELQSELDLHKEVIEGVKAARRLELKSMLDKVVVGGAGGTITFGKIASSVVIIGMISLGIYYFSGEEPQQQPSNEIEQPAVDLPEETTVSDEEVEKPEPLKENETVKSAEGNEASKAEVEQLNKEPEETTENVEIKRPTAAPMFETTEADSLEAPTDIIVDNIDGNISSLDVEIDNTKKKYSFHYQFNNGKLFLYGDFDKTLYEILEFKTRSEKTLFLYYQDKFYSLNQKQVQITELKPVREPSLIEKLKNVADISQE